MKKTITLLTDLGWRDPYLAQFKLSLQRQFPGCNLIDLSHDVAKYDRLQAAFLFRSCMSFFPADSLHMIGVGNAADYLLARYADYWVVAPDNGIIPLISAMELLKRITLQSTEQLFPLLYLPAYIHAALQEDSGNPAVGAIQLLDYPVIQCKADALIGQIMYIDDYDNLITNIHQTDFFTFIADSPFVIEVKKILKIRQLISNYDEVVAGQPFALFNTQGWLEIGFNAGSKKHAGAGLLLGARLGDRVSVQLTPQ